MLDDLKVYAAFALAGILARGSVGTEQAAKEAFDIAEAMMAEEQRRTQGGNQAVPVTTDQPVSETASQTPETPATETPATATGA